MWDYTFMGWDPFYSPFGWGFYPLGGFYGAASTEADSMVAGGSTVVVFTAVDSTVEAAVDSTVEAAVDSTVEAAAGSTVEAAAAGGGKQGLLRY